MDKTNAIKISKTFIHFLAENGYDIKQAYLFGSYAKNNYNEDSDLDIAISIANISNAYDEQIKLMRLRRKFSMKIEPHPFYSSDFNKSNPFINEILDTGINLL